MSDVLAVYVSGFWPWLGITIGLWIVARAAVALIVGTIGALRGNPISITLSEDD